MYRLQTPRYTITIISLFLCCVLIASGQSTVPETPTEITQSTSEENPTEKSNSELKSKPPFYKVIFTRIKDKVDSFIPTDEHSENQRAFDISTTGDDKIRNFSFFAKMPFKFKSTKVSLSGKYNQTFENIVPASENENLTESELQKKRKWMFLSESYALGLEVNNTKKLFGLFNFGGQIDYENGITPELDPHVHVDLFTQFPLILKYDFLKVGAGIWGAGQKLTDMPEFHSGWHFHIDINSKCFNMRIETLPQWNFSDFRAIASPELVIKPFGGKFAFVIHGEIKYYPSKKVLTYEPVVDINPWDIRWTQLIRFPF